MAQRIFGQNAQTAGVVMKNAFFPGSFDPPTHGHLNIIERAARIFDKLYVVVAINEAKRSLFSTEERLDLIRKLTSHLPNVEVVAWHGLVVDFVDRYSVPLMIRGVRALADFGYEFELAMTNKSLNKNIEIIFFPTDPQYFVLRSSAIKEIASFGGDISAMVPQIVADALKRKLIPIDKS